MGSTDEETTIAGRAEERDIIQPGERHPVLLVVAGNSLGQALRVQRSGCVVGRGAEADLRLDDEGVSRKHAKVVRLPERQFMLKDLGSTNGTFVNDKRVGAIPLRDGDRIRLGAKVVLKFTLEDDIEASAREHLFSTATRDSLTGVHNRRAFDSMLLRAVAYSRRHTQPLSLLTFDVDHFKRVNDTYGHPAGDAVLRDIAQRVAAMIRTEDVLARVGGEEFAVILPGVDECHAVQAAERLRRVVEGSPVATDAGAISVTISVGAVLFDPQLDGKLSELLRRVDARLYEAKQGGRNRVCPEPRRQEAGPRRRIDTIPDHAGPNDAPKNEPKEG